MAAAPPVRTRCCNWCFTINNPQSQLAFEGCKYAVWQLEKGAEGTPHYQGYVEFNNAVGMLTAKGRIGQNAHVEIRRGTREDARKYCMKEEGRVSGPWESGTWTPQGARSDLAEIAAELKKRKWSEFKEDHSGAIMKYLNGIKMLKTEYSKENRGSLFRMPAIEVLYGDSGVGKTRTFYEKYPDLYSMPQHETTQWFDGYDGQETILLDDFYGGLKYSFLLRLLDGYPLDVAIKGGYVRLNHVRVCITSNEHPMQWYSNVADKSALARRIREYGTITRWFKGDDPVLVQWE